MEERKVPKYIVKGREIWSEDGRLLKRKLTEAEIQEAVEADPREAEFYRKLGWTDEQYAEMVAEF